MQDQQLRRAVKFIANESQLSPNCPSRASSWVRQCPPGSNGTLLDGQQLYRGQSIPSKRSSINCMPVLGTSCIFGESWTNHQATRDAQSSHMYYQYYHVPTCSNNHMESLELDLATSCNSLSLLVQLCHAKTLQIWVERDLGEVLAKQKKLSPTRQKRNAKWPKIYSIKICWYQSQIRKLEKVRKKTIFGVKLLKPHQIGVRFEAHWALLSHLPRVLCDLCFALVLMVASQQQQPLAIHKHHSSLKQGLCWASHPHVVLPALYVLVPSFAICALDHLWPRKHFDSFLRFLFASNSIDARLVLQHYSEQF